MPPQQTATKPAEKKRKRNTGISIFQSDAPTKTARKKADEFSIFDHGVNRDAAQSNSSSWLPLSQPATFTAATAMPGVPMRRTRSRGLQPDGPSLPFVAAQPLAPHAGLGAAGIAGASTGISAASAMMAAAAAAQAEQAAQAARMLPPPLPLQPTLSEWGTLGLDLGAGPEGGGLSGVEMRRTRSRGLPSTADPSISALPGGGMGLPPPPRSQLHAGSMGRPLLPPALPMMPSLSEAALAIGLDMNEAVEALQGSPGGARLLDSPGGSPSPRRRGRHAGVPTAAHAPVAVGWSAARRPSSSLSHPACSSSLAPLQPLMLPPDAPPRPSSLQGSPMRRTRSQGLPAALPMSHSISDMVSSFINANPTEEVDDADVLDRWLAS